MMESRDVTSLFVPSCDITFLVLISMDFDLEYAAIPMDSDDVDDDGIVAPFIRACIDGGISFRTSPVSLSELSLLYSLYP